MGNNLATRPRSDLDARGVSEGPCHQSGFTLCRVGTRRAFPSRAAVFLTIPTGSRRPSWGKLACLERARARGYRPGVAPDAVSSPRPPPPATPPP
jgi:hypothetical protein